MRDRFAAHAWQPVALVLMAVAFGAGTPVPLLVRYRVVLHLPPEALTVAFGLYAAGLIPALFVGGPISDRLGRRPLVLALAGLSALSSAVLLLATRHVAALFLGRFLQGVSSGTVFSVGTVWLGELGARAPIGYNARRAAAAMSAGFGLGPLTAGILGQWSSAPLVLPYVVHGAITVAALVAAVIYAPETAPQPTGARQAGFGVPTRLRGVFWRELAPIGIWVFALPTVAISALPLLVKGHGHFPVALAGAVTAVTMVSGSAVQPLGRRLRATAVPIGLVLGVLGLSISIVAIGARSRPIILPAGLTLGLAYGLLFGAGLTAVEHHSTPAQRAALTSSFYALTYVGFAAPLAVTSLARPVGSLATLLGMACLVGLTGAALVARQHIPAARRPRSVPQRDRSGPDAADDVPQISRFEVDS